MRLFHRTRRASVPPLTVLRGPRNTAPIPTAPAALAVPVVAAQPAIRYEVRYDRVGQHGRGLTTPPPKLTVQATTRDGIAAGIKANIASYLPPGAPVQVIVDMALMAGQIRIGDRPAGTFSLRMLTGGAR